MKKFLILSLFFFFIFTSTFSSAGQVSLTTYYPAPFGNYDTLRLVPRTDGVTPSCTAAEEGTMYFDTSYKAKICMMSPDGTTAGWYSFAPSFWVEGVTPYSIYPAVFNYDASLVRVGIRTNDPRGILDVYSDDTGGLGLGGAIYLQAESSTDEEAGDIFLFPGKGPEYGKDGDVVIGGLTNGDKVSKLTIIDDGGIYASGTFGSGRDLGDHGPLAAMIWYPKKAAFRVGYVDGDQWNDGNIGQFSVAMGKNSIASGSGSFAFGPCTASNVSSFCFSGQSTALASGAHSFAFGTGATASGQWSYAMGRGSLASGTYDSIAIGYGSTASGDTSIAIGKITVSGVNSIGIGVGGASSSGGADNTFYVRGGNVDMQGGKVAIGNSVTASGTNSIAIGNNITVNASATNSVGIGVGSSSVTTQATANTFYVLGGQVLISAASASPVTGKGLTVNGTSYFSNNLAVNAGGLTVTAGGVAVTGNSTFSNNVTVSGRGAFNEVKLGNNTGTCANGTDVGVLRYKVSGTNATLEACMQRSLAPTYGWVVVFSSPMSGT